MHGELGWGSVHKSRLTDIPLWRISPWNSALRGQKLATVCPACQLLRFHSMSFALGLLILTCGSLAAIAHQLRRAPAAFEDETGFHFSSAIGNGARAESGFPLGAGADVREPCFKPHRTLLAAAAILNQSAPPRDAPARRISPRFR
jgi:hypothetical protein